MSQKALETMQDAQRGLNPDGALTNRSRSSCVVYLYLMYWDDDKSTLTDFFVEDLLRSLSFTNRILLEQEDLLSCEIVLGGRRTCFKKPKMCASFSFLCRLQTQQ
ncbi:unnamed protein product [Amoebophrya sp. A25]|nr:unnamed protein product [Amoebophrya sp. A25]|eukprot:GSA25T00022131001.1